MSETTIFTSHTMPLSQPIAAQSDRIPVFIGSSLRFAQKLGSGSKYFALHPQHLHPCHTSDIFWHLTSKRVVYRSDTSLFLLVQHFHFLCYPDRMAFHLVRVHVILPLIYSFHVRWLSGFPISILFLLLVVPPPICSPIGDTCHICGSSPPIADWSRTKAKPLTVQNLKVRNALIWLKPHNPLYKGHLHQL